MLFLLQGYCPYPYPPQSQIGGGAPSTGAKRKIIYYTLPKDWENLSEEEILALWAFEEIL